MKLKPNFWCDSYGNIYYRKTINGNPITIPTYTKDVSIANKLKKTLEYQVLMEHYSPKEKTKFRTFTELVKLYLNDKEVNRKWKPSSKQSSTYILKAFAKKQVLPKNTETARGYQTRINACINWGKRNGYRTNIKPFVVNKKQGRMRVFSDRELSLLMYETTDSDFQNFLRFAYLTGCRRGELCGIKNYHIESTRMEVTGKTGRRFVKLNRQARLLLSEQERLWNYKPRWVTDTFRKEALKLDIHDARFSDLRRTFGLNLIKEGMPIYEVSKLLGHSSVKTTEEHYAPLLIDDIKEFTLPI